ncbi:L-threonylcarbamoyladenylate synthase [Halobacteriovorax sp. GB3]|uniref:L-threonylcarbamoyladenylate synthase n=1 Tax=Halobacteriovorax sp. GB3 TaxID=2719615 RepID=UPI002360DB9F|nr:L-threonylcarbamoyladenylate synthase [Halobacteriovorax sp. GB3]MDD0854473.1 L-threonylcarbamoyladenylate synthase [Halobacteriovorax sp. GB3]
MIEYLIPENPDDRILKRASDSIKEGNLVCIPTDTSWVVVCDPFNKKGVERLYRFKGASPLKHFSLICDTISKASEVANIGDSAFRMIRNKIPGHYTFIFEATKKIIRAVQASKNDHQVGVRFIPGNIVNKLVEIHGEVLLSTNISEEMMGLEEGSMFYSYQIEEKFPGDIQLILDPGEYEFAGQSTIVDLSVEGEAELIREGAGKW